MKIRIMLDKKKRPALSQQRILDEEKIGQNYLEPHLKSRPNSMCVLYVHLAAAWKALLNDNS